MNNSLENKRFETIDCTPTWTFAMSVYIAAIIQNGYEAKEAIADLMNLAKSIDASNKK